MDKVKPRLLKGMQDSWPQLALARRRMVARIETVCRRFGFLPFDTPALEAREALLGLEPSREQINGIFTFQNQDAETVGLRFDLTVPLARVVSSYQDLARPFRRYQCGNVYRYDKPEPGRYREFMQFDIDMVGAPDLTADAEVIAVIYAIFVELGVQGFTIRYSNRKLLNALGEFCGAAPEQGRGIYRVIDKLDKYDRERIRLELGAGLTDESGAQIAGLGLSPAQVARIDEFLDLPNQGDAAESIAAARSLLAGVALAQEALDELEQLTSLLSAFGVSADGAGKAVLDLWLARGLGYYSGPVFEAVLDAMPGFGSVFGGGRYDNLVDRFEVAGLAAGAAANLPAVGASVGVDRLLAALDASGVDLLDGESTGPEVLVTVMDPERIADYIAMTSELRAAGIRAELWQGGKAGLNKQLKYANRLNIPLAVIAGSEEFEKGTVSVKNLLVGGLIAAERQTREDWLDKDRRPQFEALRNEMVAKIKGAVEVFSTFKLGRAWE